MGIRETQYFGLSQKAQLMIKGEDVHLYTDFIRRVHADGTEETITQEKRGSNVKRVPSGRITYGMFEEEIPLYEYHFPDGRILSEYIQETIWSSGPCIFVALKDENGKWVRSTKWSKAIIDNA